MKSMVALNRSLLALGFAPALAVAATAYTSYGVAGGSVTVGVVCPPAISLTATTSRGDVPWLPVTLPATIGCPNGTWSQAFADRGELAISGDAFDRSVSGSPEALFELASLVTPTQSHSRVSLTVSSPRPYWEPGRGVGHYFLIHWYGSDAGTALRLHIWDEMSPIGMGFDFDVTRIGPIDLFQFVEFHNAADWGTSVVASVIATSTEIPEPGTCFLSAALLLAGGYRLKSRH